jgi:hypothetical protein
VLAKLIPSLYLHSIGETETGTAEEQPARDSRLDGNDRENVKNLSRLLKAFSSLSLRKPKSTTYILLWSYDTI